MKKQIKASQSIQAAVTSKGVPTKAAIADVIERLKYSIGSDNNGGRYPVIWASEIEYQVSDKAVTDVIVATLAQELGFDVYRCETGYWGTPDYLISMKGLGVSNTLDYFNRLMDAHSSDRLDESDIELIG